MEWAMLPSLPCNRLSVASPRAGSRATSTIRAPMPASRCAATSPIPEVAPVMTTTLPSIVLPDMQRIQLNTYLGCPKAISQPGSSQSAPPHQGHMKAVDGLRARNEATISRQAAGSLQAPGAEPRHKIDLLEFQGIESAADLRGMLRGALERQRNGCKISGAGNRVRDCHVDLQQCRLGLRIDRT